MWVLLFVFLAVLAAGLVGFDLALAKALTRSRSLDPLVGFLEQVTLKNSSEFILPLLLILSGGSLWAFGRPSKGRAAVYVGLVQLIAYVGSDLSKPLFGRLRPFEMTERGLADTWFVGGNSFPSGHVAYFAGLIVPIVMLFPRTWPLLAVPTLVAAQRVLATDHYISDVAASFGWALITAMVLSPILRTK
jgi:membrane-associated phospholipid phosphatase